MEKSMEERLAGIEDGITRLTKMQGCVFDVLLILRKASVLSERTEQALTSVKQSLEPAHRGRDRYPALMFGAITVMGIAISISLIDSAAPDFITRVVPTVAVISALVLVLLGHWEYRRASSQFREAREKSTQADEVSECVTKEAGALDGALAQVLAEWKELVPDDLVSEPKPED